MASYVVLAARGRARVEPQGPGCVRVYIPSLANTSQEPCETWRANPDVSRRLRNSRLFFT